LVCTDTFGNSVVASPRIEIGTLASTALTRASTHAETRSRHPGVGGWFPQVGSLGRPCAAGDAW
jgi:hypothetical protein